MIVQLGMLSALATQSRFIWCVQIVLIFDNFHTMVVKEEDDKYAYICKLVTLYAYYYYHIYASIHYYQGVFGFKIVI